MLALCAHTAAELPLKRGDEALTLLHHINATLSKRADDVLAALKAALASGQVGNPALMV